MVELSDVNEEEGTRFHHLSAAIKFTCAFLAALMMMYLPTLAGIIQGEENISWFFAQVLHGYEIVTGTLSLVTFLVSLVFWHLSAFGEQSRIAYYVIWIVDALLAIGIAGGVIMALLQWRNMI